MRAITGPSIAPLAGRERSPRAPRALAEAARHGALSHTHGQARGGALAAPSGGLG
jgi:hypothetical protein